MSVRRQQLQPLLQQQPQVVNFYFPNTFLMNHIYLPVIIFLSLCLYYMLRNKLAIFFPSFSGMLSIIQDFADVDKDDVIYDLGSGDGRVLEVFAKKGIKCVGVEQDRILNNLARKRLKKYNNVKIIQGNIFDQNLSEATVIIAYLSKFVTRRLQKKIKKECKKGTKIILVSYRFKDWEPTRFKRWLWVPIRLYVL